MMKLNRMDAKWYCDLSGEDGWVMVYGLTDAQAAEDEDAGYVTVAQADSGEWYFMGFDRQWIFETREAVASFAARNGFLVPEE